MSASNAVMITEHRPRQRIRAVEERDRLGDLMDHVRERRDQTEGKRAQVDPGSAAPDAESDERCDGEAGDAVAVKVLCPNIVVTQQVKLKQ